MRRSTKASLIAVVVGAMIALAGCGDDKGSGGNAGSGNGEQTALNVDNCKLVTNEEASALAGKELKADENGPLGCPYTEPGEMLGLFSIRSYKQGGDAKAAAAKLAPTLEVIKLDGVGDDAVALADSDGSVNFIIARKGNLFVELVMTFLDITKDPATLKPASTLASTALGRLVAAA
jgi:hypothetical protein